MFSILNIFGKRKEEAPKAGANPTELLNTVSRLKAQVELLNKRNTLLETQVVKLKTEVQETAKTNKTRALVLLEKKKRTEAEMVKNEGAKVFLEKQISALESSIINRQVTDALKEGNRMVKRAQTALDVDQIDDLMDDMRETDEMHQTISDAFSRNIQEVCDNPELLEELEEIVKSEEVSMPSAPTRPITPPSHKFDAFTEEEQVKKLQASM